MSPTAKFPAERIADRLLIFGSDSHDTNNITVLFSEKRHSSELAPLLDRHLDPANRQVSSYLFINKRLNFGDLLFRQCLRTGEVEPQVFRAYKRTLLADALAYNLLQCPLQKMRRRVVLLDCISVLTHRRGDFIADTERTFSNLALVKHTVGNLCCVFNDKLTR